LEEKAEKVLRSLQASGFTKGTKVEVYVGGKRIAKLEVE